MSQICVLIQIIMFLYFELLELSHAIDSSAAAQRPVRRSSSKRRHRIKTRTRTGTICSALDLPDRKFVKRFRLTKSLFEELLNEITPYMPPTRRSDGVDVPTRLLLALSFYAQGSYQSDVGGWRYICVAQSTVSKALHQVTDALNHEDIVNKYLRFPVKKKHCVEIEREFNQKYELPGVLGCIGRTQVSIVAPSKNDVQYLNLDGHGFINVLLCCDAELNILNLATNCPESTANTDNPLNNVLERLIEEDNVTTDSGFVVCRTRADTDTKYVRPEDLRAEPHDSARCVVEECIGALKARFRCLQAHKLLHYPPAVAAKITTACCVLYNIANRAGVNYPPLTEDEMCDELRITRKSDKTPASIQDNPINSTENNPIDSREDRPMDSRTVNQKCSTEFTSIKPIEVTVQVDKVDPELMDMPEYYQLDLRNPLASVEPNPLDSIEDDFTHSPEHNLLNSPEQINTLHSLD